MNPSRLFCVYIGAQRSVSVLPTLKRLHKFINLPIPSLQPSLLRFRFVYPVYPSRFVISLFLEAPSCILPISILFHVVSAEVPHLLGLDSLDSNRIVADTVLNRLVKRTFVQDLHSSPTYAIDYWFIPLHLISTHVYAPLLLPSISSHFSHHQLSMLQNNFLHPSVDKLLNLIRHAHPDELHAETRRILQDLTAPLRPLSTD